MATIKSFTDIEQSKKLAEILPLESADMYYSHEFVNSAGDYYKLNIASEGYFDDEELLGSDIPCWSLAALLGVLPVTNLNTPALKIKLNHKYYMELCIDSLTNKYITTNDYDNPVDACYKLIVKLHELKML